MFSAAWMRALGTWPDPKAVDRSLHTSRARPGARLLRTHDAMGEALPDGTLFRHEGQDFLKWSGHAYRYSPDGYGVAVPVPNGRVWALTCPVMQAVLAAGYCPRRHPSLIAR
ncbi:hypothetical protein [Jannaschia faecimaris]|uniref:hypothetical protein n=1 Tax=Jannaschia faecimaris TaxID=1244108 RepID=UPI001B8AA51E|nr:hypothetical protein [Jannaschia faecimaris]